MNTKEAQLLTFVKILREIKKKDYDLKSYSLKERKHKRKKENLLIFNINFKDISLKQASELEDHLTELAESCPAFWRILDEEMSDNHSNTEYTLKGKIYYS